MTQEHNVYQCNQFPEKTFSQIGNDRGKAVNEGYRDGKGNKKHHAGLAIANFRNSHLDKWYAAIRKDDNGEQWYYPLTTREFRHHEPEPHLKHGCIEQDWDT